MPRQEMTELARRLTGATGRRYWRSLQELAETPEFAEALAREFPSQAAEFNDPKGRRHFLSIMGASLALAGLTACTRQPKETIAPFVKAPEDVVPGQPLHYATALTLSGIATGALVETHEGRPTKVEGNPEHTSSLGATDVFMQAAVLGLYDPDRSRTLTHQGRIRPRADLFAMLRDAAKGLAASGGAGLRVLTETVSSPTLALLLEELLARFPAAEWHQYEPASRDGVHGGMIGAFGEPLAPLYRLGEADAILSLDADFLTPGAGGPGALAAIRAFARRRNPDGDFGMNRLYAVESMPSNTGAMADHRLPLRPSEIEPFALALAAALDVPAPLPAGDSVSDAHRRFIDAVAADLRDRAPRALVVAGERQPPSVHAIAAAINERLGAQGTTVVYIAPAAARPQLQAQSLGRLVTDMEAGRVSLLLILGGNPVYTAHADLDFRAAMERVAVRVHLGLYQDETAAWCQWHVPQAHELESWGDERSADGTVSIRQPMIEPLYEGLTSYELLDALLDRGGRGAHAIVRERWKGVLPASEDFERWWRRSLHDGVVAGTAHAPRPAALRDDWDMALRRADATGETRDEGALEIAFCTDAALHDGRFANNGWLQELPRPMTRLTWDNAVLMSPATAAQRGLSQEDVVALSLDGRVVEGPVWIVPGHADDCVTVHLGYGRTRAGRVGDGAGFDAYKLRTLTHPWFAAGLSMRSLGRTKRLACTQEHHATEERMPIRHADLSHFATHPEFARHAFHEPGPDESLYPPKPYEGHAWGMAIDLNACVGCNACVTGCQSENNIPVVGREQVAGGREMHWIRVDRYFEGDESNPSIWHQPVPCMHCENAPCEPVCPVGATVHSSEGLNDMVYNRCVGTRYCANNCPYKVRRFNFFLYADQKTPSLRLLNNPDVTVRSRGVMEKCTYCVQRINAARIGAHREERDIRDGEVVTACQQACPAEAIVFGDLNDPQSRVAKIKAGPRGYALLSELGTRPRTTYLAALRNPNPALETS